MDLLTIQREIHSGIFAILDGPTAGNGASPRSMKPVVNNLIPASADQVVIDAVAAKIMVFDLLSVPYIRRTPWSIMCRARNMVEYESV